MKISVLTPCFNSGDFIERAIKSVLVQNYDNFEHIITDGGSTDNTVEILKKYPHLNWVSEPDKGQSDAMNKGFDQSTGDLIVYLNADDEFEEGIFNIVIEKFKEKPDADFVIGNLRFIWPHKTFVRNPTPSYKDTLLYWKDLFPQNPVSYFYKREVQEKTGKFPVDNHYSMDYWFLLRAFKSAKIYKVEKIFGNFYNSGDNKTAVSDSVGNSHGEVISYIWQNHLAMLPYFYTHYAIKLIYPKFRKVFPKKKK